MATVTEKIINESGDWEPWNSIILERTISG